LIEFTPPKESKRNFSNLPIGAIRDPDRISQLGFPNQLGELIELFV
jgi:hypothetical protein